MPEVCPDGDEEAVRSLLNELRSAFVLLETAQMTPDVAWRAGALEISRRAYQQAAAALSGMAPLDPADRRVIYDRMAEFRSQLAYLENELREMLPGHGEK